MRLWSIHPKYLDAKGLVAFWREGLLARHVLLGLTKGYQNHPQLIRFKASFQPVPTLDFLLHSIVDEAETRGYKFNRAKLAPKQKVPQLILTSGQLAYEMQHLKNKLQLRDPERFQMLKSTTLFEPNLLFKLAEGDIENWEKISANQV